METVIIYQTTKRMALQVDSHLSASQQRLHALAIAKAASQDDERWQSTGGELLATNLRDTGESGITHI